MKLFILLIAAFGYLYNLTLNFVTLRSTGNPTPENVADIYDAETYRKWKQYSAEHCRLKIFGNLVAGALTLTVLATDAYAAFASLFPDGMLPQLLAVILLELLIGLFMEIPTSYISDMVIEQKYGFNRTSLKTFIADRIRSLLLGILLSTLFALAIAGCHMWLGNYMAPLLIAFLFVFTMAVSFLFPYLSRIGNKFTPLEEGELRDRLMELLTAHGYRVRAIEVMDASRRTTKQNAYFTGFGKLKTIVLYDNLVNAMTTDEICAVFAHELGHGLNKDTVKLQALGMLNLTLVSLAAWFFAASEAVYAAFGFDALNYGFTYILIGVSLHILSPLTGILINAVSRKFEYAADRQAVREGYGEAMIPALKKLARDNFSHLAPSPLYVWLEYSHPPIDRRIAAIEQELSRLNTK